MSVLEQISQMKGQEIPESEIISQLKEQGISVAVVNCRFVKPLDVELISSLAAKIPRLITVEENALQGGFGSAVLEYFADEGLGGVTVERAGIPDEFVVQGSQDVLRSRYGLDAAGLYQRARRMLEKKHGCAADRERVRSRNA